MLCVLKSVIDVDFDPDTFQHVARFNQEMHRIEMHLQSIRNQVIPIPALNMNLCLQKGEEILTEISTKYTQQQVESLLTRTGFSPVQWYTDSQQLHGLALAQKR